MKRTEVLGEQEPWLGQMLSDHMVGFWWAADEVMNVCVLSARGSPAYGYFYWVRQELKFQMALRHKSGLSLYNGNVDLEL